MNKRKIKRTIGYTLVVLIVLAIISLVGYGIVIGDMSLILLLGFVAIILVGTILGIGFINLFSWLFKD